VNPKLKLNAVLQSITKEVFQKNGFAGASIILDWEIIVGSQFANLCSPEKISFPLHKKREGRLHVSASSAVAAEIAFYESQIIDKINRYFGYPAVAKILVKHTTIKKKLMKTKVKKTIPPELVATHLQNIQDKQLQQALLDLGLGIFSDERNASKFQNTTD
jgi:hypothetical protein